MTRQNPLPILLLDHTVAIEAKWSADAFNGRGLLAFRERYREGTNLVVAHDVAPAHTRDWQGLTVRFVGLAELPSALQGHASGDERTGPILEGKASD